MKNILYFVILTVICSCANTKTLNTDQALTEADKKIAKDLIQGAFDDLWAGVDSTKILNYHTEDFVILEGGEVWNNDRFKQYMRRKLAEVDRPHRTNKMDYLSFDKYGPAIQVAYYNYAVFTRADTLVSNASWLESALVIPTDQGWRLKMMQSSWAGNRAFPE